MTMRNWGVWCSGSIAALFLAATVALAGEHAAKPVKPLPYDPKADTVELFAAIEKGDIAVKFVPKDSKEAKVLIENKTDKPLNVKLPEAFAGVPVLPQLGGPAAPGAAGRPGSRTGGGGRGGNQGMGGGFGGGGMGGMGGFGNIPPEKVGEWNVPTVCLDHGKADPRPAVPYEIKPLDSYTTKAGVRELCTMLAKGEVDQRAAQAAAWHLNNDMSWDKLAAKRLKFAGGASRPYFSPAELNTAVQAANLAVATAAKQKQEPAPKSSTSRGSEAPDASAAKK